MNAEVKKHPRGPNGHLGVWRQVVAELYGALDEEDWEKWEYEARWKVEEKPDSVAQSYE